MKGTHIIARKAFKELSHFPKSFSRSALSTSNATKRPIYAYITFPIYLCMASSLLSSDMFAYLAISSLSNPYTHLMAIILTPKILHIFEHPRICFE